MDGNRLIESIDVSFIKREREDDNFFVVSGILESMNHEGNSIIKKELIESDDMLSSNVSKIFFTLHYGSVVQFPKIIHDFM